MAVVLNRIEFENYHSYINRSFQTHRFHFTTDGKNCPGLFFTKFFIVRIKKRIDLLKNVIVVHPQFRRRFISIQLRQSLS
ncbi:hypothetical protein FUT84_02480 [Treponema phagedenis]|uniref:Uncharacterized protein n=1 Tax=Treponema phagedenis TaxID=162 RepID=A0AAE6IVS9_TREPH|nr:hypothetical protein FUT79_02535 [Treponema phagedenis]QEJ99214.1 hypothetical protein FUT82_15285 [Treponema phagedenis]QEK00159.1 hypothetical protein FUT84_02480 [Treponema phagedenis]QEK04780.1 hypothetical protein FUT83_13905 [Treponema phagedenis]QEK07653.1 hypothetical protein FUT80_13585 [Treponema phagedenis]